jgi:hypothetical protein
MYVDTINFFLRPRSPLVIANTIDSAEFLDAEHNSEQELSQKVLVKITSRKLV